MDKFKDWQPLFRFLEKLDNSDVVGLVFAIICLVGVFTGWYWVCFRKGAEVWKAGIVSWNKRFGLNFEWIPPVLLKVAASVLLLGALFGSFVALLATINKR